MGTTGRRLIAYDRRLGVRFVAGADEAGRGSLAGPLVAAAVLLDHDALRGSRAARLSALNDSKQLDAPARDALLVEVLALATTIVVDVVSPREIDRFGLHRSNLRALGRALGRLAPPAEACLVDGFRLGPSAPPHRAVVDGDTKSAAIAAASIVAKVTRDRLMRRLALRYPGYGWETNVGYATSEHREAVRRLGATCHHRRSFVTVQAVLL